MDDVLPPSLEALLILLWEHLPAHIKQKVLPLSIHSSGFCSQLPLFQRGTALYTRLTRKALETG